MSISKQELCQLIPHDGVMCLLDGVEHWDDEVIHCWSESHLDQGNPLRGPSGLPAMHALEYGAQAMAVHGGLLAQKRYWLCDSPAVGTEWPACNFACEQ